MALYQWKRRIGNILWYVGVIIISMITVGPFIWTVATSFKSSGEISSSMMNFLPKEFTIENYNKVFSTMPFFTYLKNSLLLAGAGVVTNLTFGSLAGYTFAKLKFRGRKLGFMVFLASMMIPNVVIMIPLFLILSNFPLLGGNDIFGQGGTGLINSYLAIIMPGAVGGYSIFFMKQFFEVLPDELGEAAKIDGCSEFQIFSRIYLPLAKTSLATLGIMTFQAGWNSFMWPLIVLNTKEMMTVQVGLAAFQYSYSTDYGPLMAGTVVTTLPIIILFIFAQKYYVQGVADSGIK